VRHHGRVPETAWLSTPRLWLVPLDKALIDARLASDEMTVTLNGPAGPLLVHANADWPGDLLGVFPHWTQALNHPRDLAEGTWAWLECATAELVGWGGLVGPADDLELEIGYGTNRRRQGQGLATEAMAVAVARLRRAHPTAAITARTAVGNLPSHRVLEHLGFTCTGREAEGEQLRWRL